MRAANESIGLLKNQGILPLVAGRYEVSNTGKFDGEEVAQVYLMPPAHGNGGLSPKLQPEGFNMFR